MLSVKGSLLIDDVNAVLAPAQHIRGFSLYGNDITIQMAGSASLLVTVEGLTDAEKLENISDLYLEALANYLGEPEEVGEPDSAETL